MKYYTSQQHEGMELKKGRRIWKKLILLGIAVIVVIIIAAVVLFALKGDIHLFNRPISAFTYRQRHHPA